MNSLSIYFIKILASQDNYLVVLLCLFLYYYFRRKLKRRRDTWDMRWHRENFLCDDLKNSWCDEMRNFRCDDCTERHAVTSRTLWCNDIKNFMVWWLHIAMEEENRERQQNEQLVLESIYGERHFVSTPQGDGGKLLIHVELPTNFKITYPANIRYFNGIGLSCLRIYNELGRH